MKRILTLAFTSLFCTAAFSATLDFDSLIHPDELRDMMKILTAEPNHVGSPHNKANAEWILARYKEWGWDAHIESFDVLYPTPISESITLLGPKPYKVKLQEPPIKGDSSARAKDPSLPAYVAYQGDGDVTAELVYVNYGMLADYATLERLGVSTKGKIVIARYGGGWRGLKPKLAQEHGAVGCIIYSDPSDDGYAPGSVYPAGPMRPQLGLQRGSVMDITMFAGDPLTPGVAATKDAKRLRWQDSPVIMKIPTLPISYGEAEILLKSLGEPVAPQAWRGSLPITYHVGSGKSRVHMAVKSDWSLKTLNNVIAVMKGSTYPDQWLIRGNHFDAWVFGATDPMSGLVAMLAEAKAFGALAKEGYKPKRTLVYTSWDCEEPGTIGSAEWAEAHADELKQKTVLYVNTDNSTRGILWAGGSQDFSTLVNEVAGTIIDPETGATVLARWRAKTRLDSDASPSAFAKEAAKLAADQAKNIPIEALGTGSDFTVFLQHLGIPSIALSFGGEGNSDGVYHSRYDTFEHHSRFADPGFVYDALLAKTVGRLVMRVADSDLPLQRAGDFANAVAIDVGDVKALVDQKKEKAEVQAALLRDKVYQLAADPTQSSGLPTALLPVPTIDLSPLEKAASQLKKSAAAYDEAFVKNAATLSTDGRAKLQGLMQTIDQLLAPERGLPGRPWYKNLVCAPGRYTGYGAKTLPGVREAIEEQRWDDAVAYAKYTGDALNAYSDRLDEAAKVLNRR